MAAWRTTEKFAASSAMKAVLSHPAAAELAPYSAVYLWRHPISYWLYLHYQNVTAHL